MRDVTETVRKLLQLERDGVEAGERAVAGARARALMSRYGVRVSLEAEYRERVPGVGGVFWREQLLNAAVQLRGCRALRQPCGPNDYVAELVGRRDDVKAACADYKHWSSLVALLASLTWKRFLEVNTNPRASACGPLFLRAFVAAAAATLSDQIAITVGKASKEKNSSTSDGGGDAPRPPVLRFFAGDLSEELKGIELEQGYLSHRLSPSIAGDVRRRAASAGERIAAQIEWAWRQRRSLTAASSFPPPKPSRFNQLDLDDDPNVEEALRKRVKTPGGGRSPEV